jgi:hypothetical protein
MAVRHTSSETQLILWRTLDSSSALVVPRHHSCLKSYMLLLSSWLVGRQALKHCSSPPEYSESRHHPLTTFVHLVRVQDYFLDFKTFGIIHRPGDKIVSIPTLLRFLELCTISSRFATPEGNNQAGFPYPTPRRSRHVLNFYPQSAGVNWNILRWQSCCRLKITLHQRLAFQPTLVFTE